MRIEVKHDYINIRKPSFFNKKAVKLLGVITFKSTTPEINILENGIFLRCYRIEPLLNNPDLNGKFLHFSISVQENDAVMIDGIISDFSDRHSSWQELGYEGIRLQPFYLKNSAYNNNLIGKGLFERGLHFAGVITPQTVRNICICDYCAKSFTIEHLHAGFSEMQYFYSNSSHETLLIPYNTIPNIPKQLEKHIDFNTVEIIDTELAKKLKRNNFKYYNSFRCPHCLNPFIDFEKNKQARPNEYYANKIINTDFVYLKE